MAISTPSGYPAPPPGFVYDYDPVKPGQYIIVPSASGPLPIVGGPTPPAPRRSRRGAVIAVAALAVLFLLVTAVFQPQWLGLGKSANDKVAAASDNITLQGRNAARQADGVDPTATATPEATETPAASDTATPTDTPTPDVSATAAPAVVGPNPDCTDTVVELPKHYLAQSTRLPADADAAYPPLKEYKAAGADVTIYMGAYTPVKAASDFVGAVHCNGMTPFFDPDPAFNKLGVDGGANYVQQLVDARPHLIGAFVVQQNGNSQGTIAAVNARVKAIQDLNTGIPVITIHDQMSPNYGDNLALSRKFHGDRNVIGYYPFSGSRSYGSEATLPNNARVEKAINGKNAVAAVQEFHWWYSDPTTAKQFKFAKSPVIAPGDVARMSKTQIKNGAQSVLLIGLEANPHVTDVDNTKNWVVPCIKAVKAANPMLGK